MMAKTQFEKFKGERCKIHLAMFGETIMGLPPKTAASHGKQLQPMMKEGIWLGVIDRTEETALALRRASRNAKQSEDIPMNKDGTRN